MWLREGTTVVIRLGTFVDATDGATEETGLTGTMVVCLSKNGATFTARHSATAISHDAVLDGNYAVELDADDLDTPGTLLIRVQNSAIHRPVSLVSMVLPAALWDSLFGSGSLGVASVLSADERAAIADKILGRNIAGGSDGGRSVTSALRPLRNKVDTVAVPGYALVYREDDTTEDHRRALTTDASAEPIVTADPTT